MKKHFKKIISIVLVVLILSSIPIIAFSTNKTYEAKASLLQEGNFDIPQFEALSLNGFGNVDALQTHIYNELKSCKKSIIIDQLKYQFKAEEIKDIYTNVINDNPDLFYVSSSYSYSFNSLSKNVTAISPVYIMTQQEIADANVIFNQGVDKALKLIKPNMNDTQKALVIHDYMCDFANYERVGDISHSAYGFFKDGKIVCAGYALAYSYLLNKVGVQCECASSSAMMHAWNSVLIDGNWYNVDLTYDDVNCYNQGENIRGAMRHNFFLKSDSFFKTPEGGCHFGYSTYDGGLANDVSLDNAFWSDVLTYIPVIDGNYYYIDTEPSKYMYLKKRDINGNETYVNRNIAFSSPSYTINGSYPDENGTKHPVEYKDVLVRMVYMDDRFYIAYNTNLISLFANGDNYKIATLTNYPIGLGVQNGNIVYQPNQTYTMTVLDKEKALIDSFNSNNSANYNNYPDVHYDKVINTKDFAKYQNTDYIFK